MEDYEAGHFIKDTIKKFSTPIGHSRLDSYVWMLSNFLSQTDESIGETEYVF
jgi:hypothetical protein